LPRLFLIISFRHPPGPAVATPLEEEGQNLTYAETPAPIGHDTPVPPSPQ
jgi:hypothetical protein